MQTWGPCPQPARRALRPAALRAPQVLGLVERVGRFTARQGLRALRPRARARLDLPVQARRRPDGWSGPLQYLGKGPNGYDNGQRLACTGARAGSPSVICVRAGAGSGGTGTAAAPFASINAALAAAAPKDVIQVAAGAYPENVAIGTRSMRWSRPR